MKRKVRAWKREITHLDMTISDLELKHHEDANTVTLANWDASTAGKERKLQVTPGSQYPRKTWPAGVPYLNMIARAKYYAAETAKKKEKARKKAEEAKKKNTMEAEKKKIKEEEERRIEAAEKIRHTIIPFSPKRPTSMHEPFPSWRDSAAFDDYICRAECQDVKFEKQTKMLARSLKDVTSVSLAVGVA